MASFHTTGHTTHNVLHVSNRYILVINITVNEETILLDLLDNLIDEILFSINSTNKLVYSTLFLSLTEITVWNSRPLSGHIAGDLRRHTRKHTG